jgi:PKD repeat protein
LKAKKLHITIRELFRKKLEFAEVTPDAALKAKLMRRLARREFLQFNPGRINIFYLGLAATIITASLLLFSDAFDYDQTTDDSLILNDSSEYFEVAAGEPIVLKPEAVQVASAVNKPSQELPNIDKGELISSEPANKITPPGSIGRSISGSGIFDKSKTNVKTLKGRQEAENLTISPIPSSGCAPLKVQFQNISDSYDSCKWTLGDGGYSNKRNPEWIYDLEGEYRATLQVFKGNKILSASAIVIVHPTPKAHFEISPEKSASSNDEVRFLNYSTNAERFNWDFGDGNVADIFEPTHVYDKFGIYNVRLIAFSEWGCSDSLTVYNALAGSEYFIDFPNAFIPNEDGPSGGYYSSKSDEAAQVFHPSFSGVTEYQLKIFSKLGIPIYESNDIDLGWDGYNKDQLCDPGVYIWKVRGKFRNGEPFIQMGDVTLLKNQ